MVPRGLPVGKVEVVNIACGVLAAEGRGQKLVPAQVQSYLGKKEREEKWVGDGEEGRMA